MSKCSLNNLSSEDLFALAKQKQTEEKLNSRPKAVFTPTTEVEEKLIKWGEDNLKEYEQGVEIDPQYTLEFVMELVFGKDIYDYINTL